ncbi:MAG: hypothetical protein HYY00_09580 [Chloroflexi bacterium]|nr:hypothetical protein [Chloroflexota bacterium]
MFGKSAIFYVVASTIIAVVAEALGAGMGTVLLASLMVPPAILAGVAFMRYKGWV